MIHSPSEHKGRWYAGPKLGASSRSPKWVQGPKALGRPPLLSQATGRELEGKQGCQNRTGAHMGYLACKARTLTTAQPRWALEHNGRLRRGSWLWTTIVSTNAVAWRVNNWMEDLPLCLSSLYISLSKKNKINLKKKKKFY